MGKNRKPPAKRKKPGMPSEEQKMMGGLTEMMDLAEKPARKKRRKKVRK